MTQGITIEEAMKQAEALQAQAAKKGSDVIYRDAGERLMATAPGEVDYTGSESIHALMTEAAGEMRALADADPDETGKSYVERMIANLKKKLCEEGSELWKLAKKGVGWGAGAVIGVIAGALSLGPVAIALMVPVAVEIAMVGFETFCEIILT